MKNLFLSLTVILSLLIISTTSCKKDEGNSMPSCKITTPLEGAIFMKGDIVQIIVNASDADGSIVEVRFYIDDIGLGSSSSFPYIYNWATANVIIGTHSIKAQSLDNEGGSSVDEISIVVSDGSSICNADFIANPTSGQAPLQVTFTDLSTNNPTSWQWDFGDGGSSTSQNPSHTYTSDGSYTVKLIVANAYGSDTATVANMITVGSTICPSSFTDIRDNKVYSAVQIGNQCWMAENLNIGTMIFGSVDQSDNGTIEKYCYNDIAANCDIYGGLYQWDEVMQYVTTEGVQGICPAGWHVPSDEELKVLEGTVDTQYGVGNPEWDKTEWRGYDAGKHLKSTSGWSSSNGDDLYGFTFLPGGIRSETGSFVNEGGFGYLWSSSNADNLNAWWRRINNNTEQIRRDPSQKVYGNSLRCLKY